MEREREGEEGRTVDVSASAVGGAGVLLRVR
jgi:hypothetical protein